MRKHDHDSSPPSRPVASIGADGRPAETTVCPAFAIILAGVIAIAGGEARADATWVFAVEASAQVQVSPPQITLGWPQDSFAVPDRYTVYRKAPGATSWGAGLVLPGTTTSFTDTSVLPETFYEYQIVKTNFTYGYSGYGYLYAGIQTPLIEYRGKVILIVDSTHAGELSAELARLQGDLVGDGWTVIRHDVARADSAARVKSLIQADYQADPANVKAVFLFGHVPVPYSGDFAADSHSPEHQGAWPADAFYGDVDGVWTDNRVSSTVAERARNWNVPGDGKFDQSFPPSLVELQVGRVDLANLPAFTLPERELLRQYLNKNHAYRHKLVSLPPRALVHDSIGVRDGEAYAASGYRNFAAWFGAGNVAIVPVGQWFPTLAAEGYLWAYGAGGGSYASIAGLGNSGNWNEATTWDFAATDARAAFYMFAGSWLGDWDSENNIMRATLATTTFGLACVIGGQPHWFGHHLGLGETLGFSARLTQNNGPAGLYRNQINDAGGMAHIALMGDPTLRLYPVAPAANLTGTMTADGVTLNWSASPDAAAGYHVYRATSTAGPFARLTGSPASGTSFTDPGATSGTYTYLVRAIKLETTPSGSYFNSSQGMFITVSGSGSPPPPPPPPPSRPTVTVVASDATATIGTSDHGAFTFSRTGDVSGALTVNYSLGGTAVKWIDYRRPEGDMPVEVTIPAGATTYTMTIVAVTNVTGANPATVVVTLSPDAAYDVGSPESATLTLVDGSSPPPPPPPPSADTVWFDDAVPAGAWTGAEGGDTWQWVGVNPTPHSGVQAHQSALAAGIHHHYFADASVTLTVNAGDVLYAHVYLDPANPPREIMLGWSDGVSWSHAAYWGENLIPWGTEGAADRRYMGTLPATGTWLRLEVPASLVNLEGRTLSGMGFVLYDGRATWDQAGTKASAGQRPVALLRLEGFDRGSPVPRGWPFGARLPPRPQGQFVGAGLAGRKRQRSRHRNQHVQDGSCWHPIRPAVLCGVSRRLAAIR